MGLPTVNILSICAGIGGLDLGLSRAIENAHTVCYIEREASALAILANQIKNGTLADAPIWSDAVTFDGKPWRGAVDIIAAGFPCQSISLAGKQAGIKAHTKSGLWFQVKRIINEIQPAQVFLENVANIVSNGLDQVLSDLAEIGYDAEWLCCQATDAGVNQARHRWFCLAVPNTQSTTPSRCIPIAAHTTRKAGSFTRKPRSSIVREGFQTRPYYLAEPSESESLDSRETEWPEFVDKSDAVRAGLRVSDWVDRIGALGNAVIPDQAAYAYRILSERIRNENN